MNLPVQFVYTIGAAIFGAGIGWATMRSQVQKLRGDVNGLGKKYGRVVALLIRWADTEEKREQLARTVEPPR
jgi:hypothetical protein